MDCDPLPKLPLDDLSSERFASIAIDRLSCCNTQKAFLRDLHTRGSMVIWATQGDTRLKKAVRAGVGTTYANLTQPTGIGGGRAEYIITALNTRPGGIPSGRFALVEPDCQSGCPSTVQEEDMDTIIQSRFIHNVEVIQALTQMRKEWEQAANGKSLLKVKGSVGLLLADFSNVLRLTTEEQVTALGEKMTSQLKDILVTTKTDTIEI